VVDCPMPGSNEGVSFAAAEWAVELIREMAEHTNSGSIGVGLGPGGGTLDFAKRLSQLVREEPRAPRLNLVAITAGGPAQQPQYASVSYFNLFSASNVDKRIGFFAETFMPQRDFERLKREAPLGIKEAFEAKKLIDLVVTSMGDKEDPHALFRMFHDQSNDRHGQAREKTKWWDQCVGDCQYRPFSAEAPIQEAPNDLRAATLFELEELVAMAGQKDKHVILIARPCWHCPPSKTRARALVPILTQEKLRVFSKLVMDSATARELLQEKAPGEGEPAGPEPGRKDAPAGRTRAMGGEELGRRGGDRGKGRKRRGSAG
jgi:hypothetical protein